MNTSTSKGDDDSSEESRQSSSEEDDVVQVTQVEEQQQFFWLYFNKYFYSVLLLSVATGIHPATGIEFSVLGFAYFLLFLLHTIAYYALRVTDEPLDILLQKHQKEGTKQSRGTKRNVRGFFGIAFVGISALAFLTVATANIVYAFQGEGYLLDIMNLLLPFWKSTSTVLLTFTLFALSLLYVTTMRYEVQEYLKNGSTSAVFSDNMVQRAVQLLKDFKFKRYSIVNLEFLVLAFIASTGSNIFVVVVPYQFLFSMFCLIICITGSQKSLAKASFLATIPLLAHLLIGLPSKYILQSTQPQQGYLRQVLGMYVSPGQNLSMAEFLLKTLLFMLQCSKLQHPSVTADDCDVLYAQFKEDSSSQEEISRLFTSRQSFIYRIFKPVAVFAFSITALLFALSHPSMLFLCFVPFFIFGFFIRNSNGTKFFSRFFIVVITCQVMATQLFQLTTHLILVFMGASYNQGHQDLIDLFQRLLGVGTSIPNPLSNRWTFDFLYLLCLAFFGNFINRKKIISQLQSELVQKVPLLVGIGNLKIILEEEDDYLTIPDRDTISLQSPVMFMSRRSGAPPINSQRTPISQRTPRIIEDVMMREDSKVQRDDTMRGKIRKLAFKVYRKMKVFFERSLELAIIHCSKFALFALFVVSATTGATIINAILFILFLLLATISYQQVQRYWKATIIVNASIIIAMYASDVLSKFHLVTPEILNIVGIPQNSSESYGLSYVFGKYASYLTLLLVLAVTYHIMNSQRYESFLTTYQSLEGARDSEKSDLKLQSDPITKLIIRYSIFFTVTALFIECVLLPINALNIALIVLMTVIIVKYLQSDSLMGLYQSLDVILIVLKWVSTSFIFLKYMFQFESNTIISQAFQKLILSLSSSPTNGLMLVQDTLLLERFLGIENSNLPVKLFSLALVMALTNLQVKYLRFTYLTEMLKQEDKDEQPSRLITISHHIYIYARFIAYYILMPVPILLLACYSINQPSFLSLLTLLTSLYVTQASSLWDQSYRLVGIVSAVTLLIIYITQFITTCLYPWPIAEVSLINWMLGTQVVQDQQVIDKPLLPLFAVIIVCAIQKSTSHFKLQTTITKELLEDYMFDKEKIQMQWEYESPIRNCIEFRDKYMIPYSFKFSIIALQTMMLSVIIWKLNVTSLAYAVLFIKIQQLSSYPGLSSQKNDQLSQVQRLLKIQSLIIVAVTIIEYILMFNDNDIDILKRFYIWKNAATSLVCSSQPCSDSWQEWLSIGMIPKSYIILDLVLLFATELVRKLLLNQSDNTEEEPPKVDDDNDFLSSVNIARERFSETGFTLLFNFFPVILIVYLLIFSTRSQDTIHAIYLLFALYFIAHFRKMFTQNTQLIKSLRLFNVVVLISLLMFQVPLFPCPWVSAGDLYINNQQCVLVQDQVFKVFSTNTYQQLLESGASNLFALYIVLTDSLGLKKLDRNTSNLYLSPFILLVLLTELQNYMFSHPYFKVYMLEHMLIERRTDGKLRAFMFVENTHLNTLWQYKGIKEEIKILHSRLLRITYTIRHSEHSKHLLQDDHEENLNNNNERLSFLSKMEECLRLDSQGSDQSSRSDYQSLQLPLPVIVTDDQDHRLHLNKLLSHHANDIENIALRLLAQPGTPVVPLKLFIAEFKNHLQNQEEADQNVADSLMDIALKIQQKVHLKSRIDLFNQKGVGLNIAIQKGSDQYLMDGDFHFYHHLIHSKPLYNINNSDENHQETFLQIERLSIQENDSFITKVNCYLRNYMWTNLINKLLFYSLTPYKVDPSDEQTLYTIPLMKLIGYCLLSQSQSITYFTLFLNFILNADLLSLVLPLSALLYALLDNPLPNVKFWKSLKVYMLTVIFLKFIYQLPLFCGTPEFSLYSLETCSSQEISAEALMSRLDYIIGIHKFTGPSSYPKDQGMLVGVAVDLIVLIALKLQKNYLIKIGIWHYVRAKNSIYNTPSFKCDLSDIDKHNKTEKKHQLLKQYQESNLIGKATIRLGQWFHSVSTFTLRLLPVYMQSQQKNGDIRTREYEPHIVHNIKRVKPGRDYFSQSFFSLLIILVCYLFFYRSITGEIHSIETPNLQRFSIPQIAVLFGLLLLMMVERMLFRVRQVQDSQSSSVNSSILGKHQLTIKLILHLFLVAFVHVQLGFIVPKTHSITYDKKFPLIIIYLLWAYYFVNSALQIRYGYPQAPFKAPFIRDTSYFTVWAFKIYKAMPFLWEMKVIIDWTVTSTCLDLFQWFKLDDAFNYLTNCQLQNKSRAKKKDFVQRPWYEKLFQGFCFAFFLILVILAPILLFSGINPIMVTNPILSSQMQMSIELNQNGNAYNILQTQAYHIQDLLQTDLDDLENIFAEGGTKFELSNMQKMYFSPYSEVGWNISPPSLKAFIADFNQISQQEDAFFDVKTLWTFKRDNPTNNQIATQEIRIRLPIQDLQPIVDTLSMSEIDRLNANESAIHVENLFPKLLKLGGSQQSHILDAIPTMSNVSILGSARLVLNANSSTMYWAYEMTADQEGPFAKKDNSSNQMVLIVYNEEVIGALFGTALQLSVVGLYATIVIAIGRFLRLAFDRISQRVIYEEMDPETTEQLFEICEGIYIAQLEGDLSKEKKLYDLLIRMYRSPETLIRVNKSNRAAHNAHY